MQNGNPLVSISRQHNQFTHPWTQDEIDLLKKYYPKTPTKKLLKFLNNRTIEGTHRKANILGIAKINNVEYLCPNCRCTFRDAISQKRKFCSKKCYNEFNRGGSAWWIKKGVPNPTKLPEVKLKLSKIFKGRKNPHTPEWNKKISLAQRGVPRPYLKGTNNPSWRGGTTLFRGLNWKEIKRRVLERDNHRCQKCGQLKNDVPLKKLYVHHLVPYKISKNNEMSNLITLCLPCHIRIEWETFRRFKSNGFS